MKAGFWVAALICLATPAFAGAPEVSPRPVPRSIMETQGTAQHALTGSTLGLVIIAPDIPGVFRSPRPIPRGGTRGVAVEDAVTVTVSVSGVSRSPRPVPRPDDLMSNGMRSALVAEVTPEDPRRRQPRRGSVCGDRSIRGEQLDNIAGQMAGCGVENPVRITEIDGVALSQASVMECNTAEAIKDWLDNGVRPAIGMLGGGVARLQVAAHYSCRTRNNQPGARISEHGKGRAIDIAAFELRNGTVIDVESGWDDRVQGRVLRNIHENACGPFRTVLGPDADRYHQDHFHLDVARRSAGSYCR